MSTDEFDPMSGFVNVLKSAFDSMAVPSAPTPEETMAALRRMSAESIELARPDSALLWRAAHGRLRPSTAGRRFVLGSVGLVALAVAILVVFAPRAGNPLAAMDRMARRLNDVKSYRYTVHSRTITSNPQGQTEWQENGRAFWRAPDAFRGEGRIVKIESLDNVRPAHEEVLAEYLEIFPPGGMGIFIDRQKKTFVRCRFEPTGSTTYPLEPLKQIREDAPPRTRELGTKQIDGKTALGFEVHLRNGFPPRGHDWQVWIDPQTDLPLEIGYQVDDGQQPRTTTVLRISNFRWNEELDDALFDPVVPKGYREVFPENQQE